MAEASVSTDKKLKVNSIMVSQPAPENGKSPYYDLAKNYNIKVDFRTFIQVEGLSSKEFRKSRIGLNDYSAIILTSRNGIDHLFRLCEELRVNLSQETKYFCSSEAIALYLQKYIQYRKRKVFFANGTAQDLTTLLKKYKNNEKILYPCSDVRKPLIPDFLEKEGFDYDEAIMYRTVASDLSDVEKIKYDMIVFFSPSGIQSLFKNFPDFKQEDRRIAAFGPATCKAAEEAGLVVNIPAPTETARSMTEAIENYLKESNA